MNKLIRALETKNTFTENGMPTNSTSSNAVLDMFFKLGASREFTNDDIISLFISAFGEDEQLAVRCLFYNRNIRGGQGERRSFRICLKWLAINHPEILIRVAHFISEFGRWDDVLELLDTPSEKIALQLIGSALYSGDKLCAKWMPRENKAHKDVAIKLAKSFGLTRKNYRKLLSGNTNVVENRMTSNEWKLIRYNQVPSKAMSKYDEAFFKHDPDGFKNFLLTGKVNAKAIFPVDVMKPLLRGKASEIKGLRIQNQWNNLPNYVPEGEYILPICDTSGSMTWGEWETKPIEVCISLGIYLAERNKGPFQDCIIPFSDHPQLIRFKSKELSGKISELSYIPLGMNTNLEAVFNLVLNQATKFNVPKEDMPTTIIIFSDMQFDACVENADDSALEMINRKYQSAGYIRPRIVFWNLNSREGIPAKDDDKGVALIAGYSPAVLASLFNVKESVTKEELTPLDVMYNTLNSEPYDKIII